MVVDASALMAFFRREMGHERVRVALEAGGAMISSMNRTEVKGKLVGAGLFTPQMVDARFDLLQDALEIVPFDLEQSDLAAYYHARRNLYNLSSGDCARLALGESREAQVMTAESAWAKLPNLPFKVILIR